ncbi:glycosyltransferase [Bacillus sp. m3-13]|uniref:glycosyltransferase n=1 Tax=Bacillus sp. m3-13 TaxID=406124 RepID=UPI0001E89E10|nr:glycosyltransferase [Bacillus sp. m3-13]
MIDIFKEVYEENKDAVLMLIGTGELFDDIKFKVTSLGLQENVIFTGPRKDIPDLLSSMDVFILPSYFEGLGIVLVEAQASGLHCIASKDVIPNEAKVTNLLQYIPLTKNSKDWAQIVLKNRWKRKRSLNNQIINAGYEIAHVAKNLEQFYLNKCGKQI